MKLLKFWTFLTFVLLCAPIGCNGSCTTSRPPNGLVTVSCHNVRSTEHVRDILRPDFDANGGVRRFTMKVINDGVPFQISGTSTSDRTNVLLDNHIRHMYIAV